MVSVVLYEWESESERQRESERVNRGRRMRGTLTRRQAHPNTYFHFKSDFQVLSAK